MPWRNGGGTTIELVREDIPESDRFLYRVSIADVASDGPFSCFEGYDRHIMLLEGAGMTLDSVDGPLDLTTRLVPRSFPGEWNVHGRLFSGAVRDFNLIVDRASATSSLVVRELAAPETFDVPPGTTCIVHVLGGAAEAGDTLVGEAPFELPAGRLAIATVARR